MNVIRDLVGVDFPLFAFSHCRDVVAAVSRAGGFGVLGGSTFTPDSLEAELRWIDDHVDGKPYGVDILVPEHQFDTGGMTIAQLAEHLPAEHREFLAHLLKEYDVELRLDDGGHSDVPPATSPEIGEQLMDVAFKHPIRLIANALGIAPDWMIERGKSEGVAVAALVGAKEHAIRQVNAGVDLLVAQGTEAGGHCGEVSTLVVVPEVVRAVRKVRDVPVLAAGGIMTGAQMAGCMAMGAAGAWTGSVWLATPESEVSETFREKLVAASSRDTIRSKARTGKPSRQLRSAWHEAWEGPDSPGSLPLPLMSILSTPAFSSIDRAADAGSPKARELVSYWVGQGVGLIDSVKTCAQVVQDFMEEYAGAVERLPTLVD
ncbi:MAG TPA: nitronate monooxygenase [Mycobacteriales bacterium]|nr:nitronate monooxygenase [Mycobacteriales bacterium]